MRRVEIFCPSHITGLFTVDGSRNPLRRGSRGVGVTLGRGVRTWVEAEPSAGWKVEVRGIGAQIRGEVSKRVVELLKPKILQPHHVHITHRFEVPVGAGYGASGAGALGVALGLNEALNLGLTPLEAANLAHLAEIECKTGLGSVLAETFGGFSLRVRARAPSFGLVKKFQAEGWLVASLCWGSLPTRGVLSNQRFRRLIRRVGEAFLEKFEGNPTVEGFLEASRGFSEALGLESFRVKQALRLLNSEGFQASMNMLGEAVFTLIRVEELPRFQAVLSHPIFRGSRLTLSEVSEEGVRVEG
ncbi:MAG: hypothetical protein DRO52_01375 [Candidatus Hecatellales archaeon]|nr:MAG: hypothetical protein DRO52_01375 [Candidatus Hecatellales archaeon]